LYTWVDTIFTNESESTINILVSFAKHPDLRANIIANSAISKYLKEIVIDISDKREAFRKLQAKHNFDISKVLVIGDNNDHEGKAATILGYDFINVFDFAKILRKDHI